MNQSVETADAESYAPLQEANEEAFPDPEVNVGTDDLNLVTQSDREIKNDRTFRVAFVNEAGKFLKGSKPLNDLLARVYFKYVIKAEEPARARSKGRKTEETDQLELVFHNDVENVVVEFFENLKDREKPYNILVQSLGADEETVHDTYLFSNVSLKTASVPSVFDSEASEEPPRTQSVWAEFTYDSLERLKV